MLFDDAQKFFKRVKKAGVDATFQTWDATLHAFQILNLLESEEAFSKVVKFVEKLFS